MTSTSPISLEGPHVRLSR